MTFFHGNQEDLRVLRVVSTIEWCMCSHLQRANYNKVLFNDQWPMALKITTLIIGHQNTDK